MNEADLQRARSLDRNRGQHFNGWACMQVFFDRAWIMHMYLIDGWLTMFIMHF